MLVLPGTAFLTAWMGLMVELVKKEQFGWKGPIQPSPGNRVQALLAAGVKP